MLQEASFDEMAALQAQNGGQQSKLIVRFYYDGLQNSEKTEAAGRPIFDEVEFIEIRIPGEKNEIRARPVRYRDRLEFAAAYAAFKNGQAAPASGTPLDKLPFLTKAQVLEFQAVGLKTAENLRDMSDANAQRFMGINTVRKRVADFLAAADGNAPLEQMRSELEKRDAEIEVLRQQVAGIAGRVDAVPPKRRGRPPKVRAAE